MNRFTITLPDDLYTWLRERAEAEGRSMSKQNEYFLRLFRDTVGAHSIGLGKPVGYSLQDERWQGKKK